jgi:hypothetical protein
VVADLLVRRALAVWIVERVSLQMLPLGKFHQAKPLPRRMVKPYIPEKLPPAEIENTSFKAPSNVSAQTQGNQDWWRTAANGLCGPDRSRRGVLRG